jgi:hypothetical protein
MPHIQLPEGLPGIWPPTAISRRYSQLLLWRRQNDDCTL